jgi:hypothetical protein
MRARERGAGLLIPVVLVLTVAAFAVIVAASQSRSDIHGSDANADALQALYLAEAGVERALKRFATGTACDAGLAETISDLSTIGLGSTAFRITIGTALTTDFAGAALVATQCRVPVTGTVLASNVSRTVHAIVDRNLLDGTDNPTFNNPLTGATPSGWTGIDPAAAFAANGGPDGTAPNCSRSAWTARNNPGAAGNDRRATASVNVAWTVTAGSVTAITFHRRAITRTADCGALPATWAGALPGGCGAGLQSTVCFHMIGVGGPAAWFGASNADPIAGPGLAACPTTFNPCTTSYQAGVPTTKVSVNVTMTGATSVNQFIYYLQLQNAGRKELFVDHIEVTNSTAIGGAQVRVWRDCSTVATPATCT